MLILWRLQTRISSAYEVNPQMRSRKGDTGAGGSAGRRLSDPAATTATLEFQITVNDAVQFSLCEK